jgi:ABC-type multidrug transport system fused ATPase/permease subunit
MPEKQRTVLSLLRDKSFRKLLASVGKYRWLYVAAIVSQIAGTGVSLVFAQAGRRLFDLAPHIPDRALAQIIAAVIGATILREAFTFCDAWVRSRLNETVVYELRRNVLNHIQNLPLSFHEDKHSSVSMNIIYRELEIAKDFIVSDVQRLISLPISFLIIAVYLASVHPVLAVIAVAVGPMQLWSNWVMRDKLDEVMRRQSDITRAVYHRIGETLHGIREVKANQLEPRVDQEMAGIQAKGVAYNVQATQVRTIRGICRELPNSIGYVVGLAVGAGLMAHGEIGAGGLVAFMSLLDKTSVPFATVVDAITSLQSSLEGARRLYDVLDIDPEDKATGLTLPSAPPSIEFDRVSFSYVTDIPILSNLSFKLPAGASLALVGPSGGKSTLIKLIYRFYDPATGTVSVDGRPIQDYAIGSLRSNMALVSQDIFLFDATIGENIAVGRPDATPEQIERAARLSQAWDFIQDLPNGLDSAIGERGIRLSQGQKQRLSIARAILRDASLLILDEPTSALDVETEASFQRDLGQWAEGCTKIIIAHRLSTIREVDYVLFLEHGEAVEFGTPTDLLARKGRFADYWDRHGVLSFSV